MDTIPNFIKLYLRKILADYLRGINQALLSLTAKLKLNQLTVVEEAPRYCTFAVKVVISHYKNIL